MENEFPPRTYMVVGNWQCNGSVQSVKDYVNEVLNSAKFDTEKLEVVVAPISIHIASAKALLNSRIKVACQNISHHQKGAYTGEISAEQLSDFDVKHVLIGSADRRTKFEEDDEAIS